MSKIDSSHSETHKKHVLVVGVGHHENLFSSEPSVTRCHASVTAGPGRAGPAGPGRAVRLPAGTFTYGQPSVAMIEETCCAAPAAPTEYPRTVEHAYTTDTLKTTHRLPDYAEQGIPAHLAGRIISEEKVLRGPSHRAHRHDGNLRTTVCRDGARGVVGTG